MQIFVTVSCSIETCFTASWSTTGSLTNIFLLLACSPKLQLKKSLKRDLKLRAWFTSSWKAVESHTWRAQPSKQMNMCSYRWVANLRTCGSRLHIKTWAKWSKVALYILITCWVSRRRIKEGNMGERGKLSRVKKHNRCLAMMWNWQKLWRGLKTPCESLSECSRHGCAKWEN